MTTEAKPKKTGARKKPVKKLMGHVKPRIHTPFLKGPSKVDEVAELAEKIGMPLLEWQRFILEDMLRVDEKGEFRRKTLALLIARQSGKTHLARMLILAHLFLWNSKMVIGMSSNRNMALDTFRQVANVIEDNDFLKAQVKQIRFANGQESITTLKGNRYQIVAATRDGSRGLTANFLFIDELREITEEGWKAARPTTRATGGQTLTCSNAGDSYSTVLNSLREMALSYPSPTLGYYEYSAPAHCKVDDRNAWAMANPSLGTLISEETLEEAVATNPINNTRTEMLCQWVDSMTSPFTTQMVTDTSDASLQIALGGNIVFAIDVSPSKRSGALLAGKLNQATGKIELGLMQLWTSDVAIDDLKMASDIHTWALKFKPRVIMYDKYATASIAQRLQQSGHKLEDCSGQSFYQACGETLDAFVNLRIVHSGQKELTDSWFSVGAKTNDAGWRIVRRRSAGDVTSAICSAMIVHYLTRPQSTPQIYV
jgi:phage terminase large subunit-like protein